MRGKWLLIGSGVALAVAVTAGVVSLRRARTAVQSAPAPRPEPQPEGDVLLSGKIRARHVVGVGATISGNIELFLADVGQEVAEGQLLAKLSNQGLETGREVASIAANNAQARVTKLEAAITAARLEASRAAADATRARDDFDRADKTYRRQRMLHGEGATPRMTYEKSERDFQSSQADYENLAKLAKVADQRIQSLLDELQTARKILEDKQKQLEMADEALTEALIHSPVDGVVVSRTGEVGKPAPEQGSDLFQIATDLLQLEVFLEPDPPTLQRIRVGEPALVVISDFQSDGIPGKVGKIEGGNVTVEFTSPNPAIKPGLRAEVRIRAGSGGPQQSSAAQVK